MAYLLTDNARSGAVDFLQKIPGHYKNKTEVI